MEGFYILADADGEQPALDLPETTRGQRATRDRMHVAGEGFEAVVSRVGGPLDLFQGSPVWFVAGAGQARAAIQKLGAVGRLIPASAARRDVAFAAWLAALPNVRKVRRRSDGLVLGVVPPMVVMGQNPVAVALGPNHDHEDEPVDVDKSPTLP